MYTLTNKSTANITLRGGITVPAGGSITVDVLNDDAFNLIAGGYLAASPAYTGAVTAATLTDSTGGTAPTDGAVPTADTVGHIANGMALMIAEYNKLVADVKNLQADVNALKERTMTA